MDCRELIEPWKWFAIIMGILFLCSEGLGLAKTLDSHSVLAAIRDIVVAIFTRKKE